VYRVLEVFLLNATLIFTLIIIINNDYDKDNNNNNNNSLNMTI